MNQETIEMASNKFSNFTTDELLSSYGSEKAHASNRSFLNVEPNISVRPEYGKRDYYAFRQGQNPLEDGKGQIRQCMEAYKHIGIISTIIDLMGDFGCQGIHIVHTNPATEKFLRDWFQKVNGPERSERFLNTLFRCGTSIVKRKYAKVKRDKRKFALGKTRIPIEYRILNPLAVDVKDPYKAIFTGEYKYVLLAPSHINNLIGTNNMLGHTKFNIAPNGGKEVDLSSDDLSVYFYKKDDWELWGRPIIAPILDDLAMMEQMKLADMSALDGAISNVRLWTLGHLDGPVNSILPTAKSINRLRNILASNVGGGTMDLVWGPELKMTESATELYKWLGDEKYGPVLNSIYAGLGVPPTMTGMSESSGSFTNNFVSLKVMIDRLEYGRKLLTDFWRKEIAIVVDQMGFRGDVSLKYDHMALHDEAAEKALLIQLVDRNYLSIETLQERFKEDPNIERIRIERETKETEEGKRPPKAGPYHDPDHKKSLEKIALQKDLVNPEDLDINTTKTKDELSKEYSPTGRPEDGRPKNSKDTEKRKQRRVLPTKAELF